jgi:hypothetical protein
MRRGLRGRIFRPLAKFNYRNLLRLVPLSGCPEFKLQRLSDFSITIPSIYMQAAHRQMAPYIVVSLVWLDEKFKQLF